MLDIGVGTSTIMGNEAGRRIQDPISKIGRVGGQSSASTLSSLVINS